MRPEERLEVEIAALTFEEVDRLMSDTERQNVKFLAQCRELKRSKSTDAAWATFKRITPNKVQREQNP
jgi:hypothetical protein